MSLKDQIAEWRELGTADLWDDLGYAKVLLCDSVQESLREACDALEASLERIAVLEVPYCLGQETIERLAEEGQMVVKHNAFIAASDLFKKASDLFKKDPYKRIAVLEEALRDIATYTPPFAYLREDPSAELLVNIAHQALKGDAK